MDHTHLPSFGQTRAYEVGKSLELNERVNIILFY